MDDVLDVDVGAAEPARPAGDVVGVRAVDRLHVERHFRDLPGRRPGAVARAGRATASGRGPSARALECRRRGDMTYV